MNKLLLFAISFLFFTLQGYSAPRPDTDFTDIHKTFEDSTIKKSTDADLKGGFKDLFQTSSVNGMNLTKLNPMAISFVQDYMQVHSKRLSRMKGWGKPYFDMISNVLVQHGLPSELKYLAVIESDLKSSALSWAGAVGPWQLMAGTARDLGLTVNSAQDDRTDYFKSTHAAARYLTDLFGVYNDWLLVIAAYNCGTGNVNAAIRKSGSRNFWNLQYYLPAESRNHVKKFIATHYIMEGDGSITTVTRKEAADLALNPNPGAPADTNTEVQNVSGKYNSIAIAQVLQMDQNEFNRLNPNFDRQISANGSYDMRLPKEKVLLFQASKPQILELSIRLMLASGR